VPRDSCDTDRDHFYYLVRFMDSPFMSSLFLPDPGSPIHRNMLPVATALRDTAEPQQSTTALTLPPRLTLVPEVGDISDDHVKTFKAELSRRGTRNEREKWSLKTQDLVSAKRHHIPNNLLTDLIEMRRMPR
jgi:hypothetical protein